MCFQKSCESVLYQIESSGDNTNTRGIDRSKLSALIVYEKDTGVVLNLLVTMKNVYVKSRNLLTQPKLNISCVYWTYHLKILGVLQEDLRIQK